MKLVFITEARFIKLSDGSIFSIESSFAMSLYKRYLEYFDEIVIFARTRHGLQDEVIANNRISEQFVKVIELPYYVGFNQFLKKYISLKKALNKAIIEQVDTNTVVICRVPGRIGAITIDVLKKKNIPYGIEVVGDPYDVLSNGATNHPLAPIIRHFSFHSLKEIAKYAPAALYVTKFKLQERYPCSNFSVGVSDVVMTPDAYVDSPKKLFQEEKVKLICIGTLAQMYKAPDVIIKAMRILADKGIAFELKWIGEGQFKDKMTDLVNQLGLENHIKFVGKLPGGSAVRNELDASDLFIMASRMEGLPRAMVEAMARSLPCIGTNICGIPELLDREALVDVNDVVGLAQKIEYFIENIQFTHQQSVRNLEVAHSYEERLLDIERKAFYDKLKQLSE